MLKFRVLSVMIGAFAVAATMQAQTPDPLVINPQDPTASATYSGTTTGAPVWNRPLAGNPPTALSATGTAVPWSAVSFTVSATGSYVFQSLATAPANWDNFTFLYINSFNPAQPLTNALIGNDDNPTIGTSGFNYTLSTGTTYFFVTTGFNNSNFGAFTNTITGPGNINLNLPTVPEGGVGPLTFALVAGGLLAVRYFVRKDVTA